MKSRLKIMTAALYPVAETMPLLMCILLLAFYIAGISALPKA